MPKDQSSIKSIVSRFTTDKPVRKTSYQVKGVLMKEFPGEPLIPFINGNYRNEFLYPRIQVKILNEQIYLVGIKEGVEPIESIMKSLELLNFGNITFKVENIESEKIELDIGCTDKAIHYNFLSPWIALNRVNLKRYKGFSEKKSKDQTDFLRRLLSQNIAFIGKEFGLSPESRIFVDLSLESTVPKMLEDGKAGSFNGSFNSNFVLPNYIGVGNGITKGFGVLLNNINESSIIENSEKNVEPMQDLPEGWENEAIDPNDIPRSKRNKPPKEKKSDNEPNFNTAEYHSKTH